MRKLKQRNYVPPDGFRYTHSETGHTSRAGDWDSLVTAAKDHRRVMKLPIPDDLVALMEDQLCAQLTPEWCEHRGLPYVETRMSWGDMLDGMNVFKLWAQNGMELVPQEEAERRSDICAGCYLNVSIPGCGPCHGMARIVSEAVGAKKTRNEHLLKACGVCKCLNSAAVHFPLDILNETDTPARQASYPAEFCWKSKVSPNYAP